MVAAGRAALAGAADRPPHAAGRGSARADPDDRVQRRGHRRAARARRWRQAAFDLPDKVAEQHRAFERGNTPPGTSDLRTRLTAVGNNGRLGDLARRAREAEQNQLAGRRGRHVPARVGSRSAPLAAAARVVDGHSLYYEVRAELGWIGIALLPIVFAVPLAVAVGRLWGPGRHSHAAFLAAGTALLLHAMVDWDWEMPALFIWFFGAAGAIIAAPAEAAENARAAEAADAPRRRAGVLLVAVTPLSVTLSQSRLNRAIDALRAGDCATATDAALGSIDALNAQAGAFEILGWCDAKRRPAEARGGGDAQRAAARPGRLALRLRPRGDAGAGRGRTHARGRSPGAAAQPARAVCDHAGTAAAARQPARRRRGEPPPLADPLRLAVNDERRAEARLW